MIRILKQIKFRTSKASPESGPESGKEPGSIRGHKSDPECGKESGPESGHESGKESGHESGLESGMTLTEILVSVGIFGIFLLGLLQLVAFHTERIGRAQAQNDMSRGILEFLDAADVYFTSAARIVSCNCGAGAASRCLFNSPACAAPGPCGSASVTIETEDANDPSQVASGTCLRTGMANPIAGTSGIIPRGCKRLIQLDYTPPTSGGATSTMGSLTLSDVTVAATPRVLNRLEGVTHFVCGQPGTTAISATATAAALFRIEGRVKARDRALPTTTVQSWYPGESGFNLGFHREITTEFTFRNLSAPGIYLGKYGGLPMCARDGQAGSSSAFCCSGYSDGTNCIAAGSCILFGQAGTVDSCCSHLVSGGNCL